MSQRVSRLFVLKPVPNDQILIFSFSRWKLYFKDPAQKFKHICNDPGISTKLYKSIVLAKKNGAKHSPLTAKSDKSFRQTLFGMKNTKNDEKSKFSVSTRTLYFKNPAKKFKYIQKHLLICTKAQKM